MSNDVSCNTICLLHLQTWYDNSILMFLCNVHLNNNNDDDDNVHPKRSGDIILSNRT